MSSKGRRDAYMSVPNDSSRRERATDVLADVVLLIQGKQLKTNSTLLANSSPTFARMISDARMERDSETEVLYDATVDRKDTARNYGSFGALRIEVPNQSYSDMKIVVKAIQNHDFKPDKLTGEQALQIMPLVDHYKMKRLRKTCSQTILESVKALQVKHSQAPIPLSELLKFLSVADQYKLREVKELCLDECTRLSTASNRNSIIKERHLSEKCKTDILNKMCDRMQADFEVSLKRIRDESDRRFAEIERKRDEYMEVIQKWKTDLKDEVDSCIKETKELHENFKQKLERQKVIDRLSNAVADNNKELRKELYSLREDMHQILTSLQVKAIDEDKELPEELNDWDIFIASYNHAVGRIDANQNSFTATVTSRLLYCNVGGFQKNLQGSFAIQEKFDEVSTELAETIKQLSEVEANYQREKLDHERAKVELLRHQRREHNLNTWIEWAKPPISDGADCLCFRHTRQRKGLKTQH